MFEFFGWALVSYWNGTGKSSCSNHTNSIFSRYDEFIWETLNGINIQLQYMDSYCAIVNFCFDTFRRQNDECITLKMSMRSTFHWQIVHSAWIFPMYDRRFRIRWQMQTNNTLYTWKRKKNIQPKTVTIDRVDWDVFEDDILEKRQLDKWERTSESHIMKSIFWPRVSFIPGKLLY